MKISESDFDVLIFGADFGGLATTAALRRNGVPRARLHEGGERYGAFG